MRTTALRRLALGSTILTALLITVGGIVRATGSGLGCPGWPKCFGRWIPPLEYHAVIEYSHRLITSVDVVIIAVLAAFATVFFRRHRRVFVPSVAALLVIVLQALLGAVVVKGELEAVLVTAHFSTAMILLGVLTYASVSAFSLDTPTVAGPTTGLARAVAAAVFILMVLGAFVRGEGASLAFFDWPLMNGRLVPDLGRLTSALHFAHRAVALVTGGLAIVLAVAAWKNRRVHRSMATLAVALVSVFGAQVLVGAANVWSRLAPAAVAAHVALAGATWALAVATASVSRLAQPARPPRMAEPLREPELLVGKR